jgi:hypothetical protein
MTRRPRYAANVFTSGSDRPRSAPWMRCDVQWQADRLGRRHACDLGPKDRGLPITAILGRDVCQASLEGETTTGRHAERSAWP